MKMRMLDDVDNNDDDDAVRQWDTDPLGPGK